MGRVACSCNTVPSADSGSQNTSKRRRKNSGCCRQGVGILKDLDKALRRSWNHIQKRTFLPLFWPQPAGTDPGEVWRIIVGFLGTIPPADCDQRGPQGSPLLPSGQSCLGIENESGAKPFPAKLSLSEQPTVPGWSADALLRKKLILGQISAHGRFSLRVAPFPRKGSYLDAQCSQSRNQTVISDRIDPPPL